MGYIKRAEDRFLPKKVDKVVHGIFNVIDTKMGQATSKVPLVKFLKFFAKHDLGHIGRDATSFFHHSGKGSAKDEVHIDDFKKFVAQELEKEKKKGGKPKFSNQLKWVFKKANKVADVVAKPIINYINKDDNSQEMSAEERL